MSTVLLTVASVLAAALAAYFSWRQLRSQRCRWAAEDARKSPEVLVLLSSEHSSEGWFHGVWQVTNRADYDIELLKIEAKSPSTLMVGELDPATDGPVAAMKVVGPGKVLGVSSAVRASSSASKHGVLGRNFLYRMADTPESDRGKTVRLRFHMREVENPTIRHVKEGSAVVPDANHS